MKYTTHKLPTAELDPNSKSSGQEFGEAGQERSLERGESVDVLQDERNSSQNELERELLSHADGIVDELEEPASESNHPSNPSNDGPETLENDSNSLVKKSGKIDGSEIPARSTNG